EDETPATRRESLIPRIRRSRWVAGAKRSGPRPPRSPLRRSEANSRTASEFDASRSVPPIDVVLVGHRLVDQRVEIRVMGFQRLASADRSVGADRRGAGAGGVEVGLDARDPVFVAVARRRGPAPEALAFCLVVQLLKRLVKRVVQALHPQLVLLF